MHKTALSGAVVALAAGLLACGCGSSTGGTSGNGGDHPSASAGAARGAAPTAAQVAATMKQATSVHVTGTVKSKGSTTSLSLNLTRAGALEGSVSLGKAPVEVLLTHGQDYVKVSSAFLHAENMPTSACTLICGRWIKAPASTIGSLNQEAWGKLVAPLGGTAAKAQMSTAKAVTFDGQPAWQVTGAQGATAYIARAGQPYLLGLKQGSDDLTFSQWGHATVPGPPPASSVVSIP